MASELQQLGEGTRAAWRQMCANFQATGHYPRTRAEARSIAQRNDGDAADVLALAGFKSPDASRPARRIAAFLHGRNRK